MNTIKKIPLPITGVALGFAALGNLIQSYSETARLVCGGVSFVLLLLFIIKLIVYPKSFADDMKDSITASVFGTFPMALMLLSAYIEPYIGAAALYFWYFAIALHLALIVYFTIMFIFRFNLGKVFASYFIVYVGIVVASVSSPVFEEQALGRALFWFGLVTLIILLFVVTIRYIKKRDIPAPAKPLFCIYAAPVSLCLAGYIQSFEQKSAAMITVLLIASLAIYIIAFVAMLMFLKLKFSPAYAAFTFPFVISAIAVKQSFAYLTKMGCSVAALEYVALAQMVIAAVLVLYALIRYLASIFARDKKQCLQDKNILL